MAAEEARIIGELSAGFRRERGLSRAALASRAGIPEERLSEIEEGRALYKSRVAPALYQRNFYDRALVDILVKSKGHIKSPIW